MNRDSCHNVLRANGSLGSVELDSRRVSEFRLLNTLSINQIRLLLVALIGLSIPAFYAPYVGTAMAALISEVDPGNPYFLWLHPGLLYGVMPLCVLSAVVLVMSPGLLAVLLINRVHTFEDWLLKGFAITFPMVSVSAGLVQMAIGRPLTGPAFVSLILVLTCGVGLGLYRRVAKGHAVSAEFFETQSIALLGSMVVIPLVFLIGLTPKFFWEAFNGDGAHGFEAARLLLYQGLPFWPAGAGDVSSFPGMNDLMVIYPPSWFLRLFGETESAVRLPLVLCMPLLFAAIVSAVEGNKGRRLPKVSLALIWGAVVSFEIVMAYSATYNPYSADVAMPAVMDTLVMISYLATVAAFIRGESGWVWAWAFIALLTSPASLVLLGMTLLGLLVSSRPRPYRLVLTHGIGLAMCLLTLSLVTAGLSALGFPSPGGEHSPFALIRRFADIAVADVNRIGWAVLPCGIYPVFGLFMWRRSDQITRALIITTGGIFAMYYLMGSVSLHYFVPVMLIPVVVFWRQHAEPLARASALVCTLGVCLSLWFSLPATKSIYTASRTIGRQIEVLGFSGYERMDPEVFAASERLTELFPTDGHPDVPERAYGESPLPLLFYAMHAPLHTTPKSYGLARSDFPRPRNADEVYRDEAAAVFVYDTVQWQKDRTSKPQASKGKSVFAVPRNVLFYRGPDSQRLGFFSPGRWLVRRLELEDYFNVSRPTESFGSTRRQ